VLKVPNSPLAFLNIHLRLGIIDREKVSTVVKNKLSEVTPSGFEPDLHQLMAASPWVS
jgi:hypothetical protein